jgi:hypothetical protein
MPLMHSEDVTMTKLALDCYLDLMAELREELGNENQTYKSLTKSWGYA